MKVIGIWPLVFIEIIPFSLYQDKQRRQRLLAWEMDNQFLKFPSFAYVNK